MANDSVASNTQVHNGVCTKLAKNRLYNAKMRTRAYVLRVTRIPGYKRLL